MRDNAERKRAEEIYNKFLQQKSSKEENIWLERWMHQYRANETIDDEVSLMIKDEASHIKEQLVYKINKTTTSRLRLYWAAAVIFLLGCSWLGYTTWFQTETLIVVSTDKTFKEIQLPDGTHVILNHNSQISYPPTFSSNRREIKFEGEGFFDVQSDSLHPFVIETDLMKIKVVGTVFNLKSYKEDSKVETSLIEGKIVMLSKDEKTTLSVLESNQKFIASKQTLENKKLINEAKISVEKLHYLEKDSKTPIDLAWKEGKIAFHSTSLSDIVKMIKRKYDIDIEIENKEVASYTYTATFDQESIFDILNALRIVKNFNYRKEGERVVIY